MFTALYKTYKKKNSVVDIGPMSQHLRAIKNVQIALKWTYCDQISNVSKILEKRENALFKN
jgi:hypothetical protein